MKLVYLLLVMAVVCGCSNTDVIKTEDNVTEVIEQQIIDDVVETIDEQNNDTEEFESGETEVIEDEKDDEEIVTEIIDENETKELFGEYYARAEEQMQSMTLEEKISQMFLVQYPGKTKAEDEVSKYCPGGYILFAKDVENETKDSLSNLITSFQDESKAKMFFAVDEEGGPVIRISNYSQYRSKPFSSVRKLYNNGGMDSVIEDSKEKSLLLNSLGINMNLTPVVDIPTNSNSYMYSRAISTDEAVVSEFSSKIIARMNEDKMVASMKHFPGYGDNVDTHTGIAIDERSLDDFRKKDFKPFVAGIEMGVPTIMVNHNIIKNIDDSMPASISKNVHDILREELEFSGLIITDSLAMDAIKKYVQNGEAAVQAVISGNDMIITASLEAHVNEVVNAINDGRITEEQINTAVRRILACKMSYGII